MNPEVVEDSPAITDPNSQPQVGEFGAIASSHESAQSMSIEMGQSAGPGPQQPGAGLPPLPAAAPTLASLSTQPTDISSMMLPEIADDADLIEKEWVEKAKEIVERTKTDPHAQNEEMTRMKANYIKKRYNREIRLDEKA